MQKPPTTVSLPCPNCGGRVELSIEHRDREEVEHWIAGVERLRDQGDQPAAPPESVDRGLAEVARDIIERALCAGTFDRLLRRNYGRTRPSGGFWSRYFPPSSWR